MVYFEAKTTPTKKIFTIKFPYDAIFSINWDVEDVGKLKELEKSEKVSDQIEMLRMIAEKMEKQGAEFNITKKTGAL